MIDVKISPGEFMDKITILRLKKKFIENETQLKNINAELEILEPIIVRHKLDNTKIKTLFDKLYEINLKLWKIEDDIRDHERNSDFGSSFIELARSVYFTNDARADIKKQINIVAGSNIIEEKSYSKY